MRQKYMLYVIIVTLLTTGFAWQKLLTSNTNDPYRSGASRGSSWSSFMGGGSWSGGSGGHK